MAWTGIKEFVEALDQKRELQRISEFVNPILEITEFADRVVKNNGPALLFENNDSEFPVLINAFASEERMAIACSRKTFVEIPDAIEKLLENILLPRQNFMEKIAGAPGLIRLANLLPSKQRCRGRCQNIILRNPDLGILPVLKCWPHDGGRYITLPIVHTCHPETRMTNAGMYRMQILDSKTTAMHWQMHKTGTNHFEAWKKAGKIMPVSVILGGDPVYTYAATAPLPENIDEYILAGLLRMKKVKMVRCITNDIYVPEDADFVIEGYIDPSEPPVTEGPFGDHTGFYSLEGLYPKFHITCITHSKDAVYPATVTGIPPMEDAWFTKTTERIFLKPLKMTILPEIEDLHLPPAGVAHNLAIVKICKKFPGQGLKVINSIFGAGQLMFTKYLIVISGDVDIRDYKMVALQLFMNACFKNDVVLCNGPLDVLDHSCKTEAYGSKMGIDATVKMPQEIKFKDEDTNPDSYLKDLNLLVEKGVIKGYKIVLDEIKLPVLLISIKRINGITNIAEVTARLIETDASKFFRLILAVDEEVDLNDYFMVAWYILANSNPARDTHYISDTSILIDGTNKAFSLTGFPRPWPDIVCSDEKTITDVDNKWRRCMHGEFISSPSLKYRVLRRGNSANIGT